MELTITTNSYSHSNIHTDNFLIRIMMNLSFPKEILLNKTARIAMLVGCLTLLAACEDNTSSIGPALASGETQVTIDSLSYCLDAKSVECNSFDARTGYLLLGNLDVKEYGSLDCSFVTRLMCSTEISVPDSLLYPERVDSCKILLGIGRNDLVGDSLTPQKVAAYRLIKQLPSGITNDFNPEGYYDPQSPLGIKSYTTSMVSSTDSLLNYGAGFYVSIPVDKKLGMDVFTQYKENPEIFQWPQTFAEYFPGLYVNSFFGKGCVANVQRVRFYIYYHTLEDKTTVVDGDTITKQTHVPQVTCPFVTSAEVLSSNNIKYNVSDYLKNMVANGENVITTPGGYRVNLKFPGKELVDRYKASDHNLSVVNNLTMSIPAEVIENDYGIGITPTLLLIKSSKVDDFFANNELPDSKTSFTAVYSSSTKQYNFTSMREYILDLLDKDTITDDDVSFTLVPVSVTEEVETNSYYGTSTSYVTKCTPYASKPTMTRIHTEDATIVFSFSSQYLK